MLFFLGRNDFQTSAAAMIKQSSGLGGNLYVGQSRVWLCNCLMFCEASNVDGRRLGLIQRKKSKVVMAVWLEEHGSASNACRDNMLVALSGKTNESQEQIHYLGSPTTG